MMLLFSLPHTVVIPQAHGLLSLALSQRRPIKGSKQSFKRSRRSHSCFFPAKAPLWRLALVRALLPRQCSGASGRILTRL